MLADQAWCSRMCAARSGVEPGDDGTRRMVQGGQDQVSQLCRRRSQECTCAVDLLSDGSNPGRLIVRIRDDRGGLVLAASSGRAGCGHPSPRRVLAVVNALGNRLLRVDTGRLGCVRRRPWFATAAGAQIHVFPARRFRWSPPRGRIAALLAWMSCRGSVTNRS